MSSTTFILWVLLLTGLLVFPVSKLVWVVSVRRLQRKLERELREDEIAGQRRRAWVLGAFLAFLFAVLYNLSTLGPPTGG